LLFIVVIGGIYGGLFTPTEAAGVGAFGGFLIALTVGALTPDAPKGLGPLVPLIGRRFGAVAAEAPAEAALWAELGRYGRALAGGRLDWQTIMAILVDTARTTAMLFAILIGAVIFAEFVNRAGLPSGLEALVTGHAVSPITVMLIILGIYIVLGCVFESLSMLLLTIPVFFPIVVGLDFGLTESEAAVWFGILAVVVTEISLITPPVGLNVFVLGSVLPDVKTSTIFRGVTPFWVVDIARLAVLLFVPTISLVLPNWFYHCDRATGFPYEYLCPAPKTAGIDRRDPALPAVRLTSSFSPMA